MIRKIVGVLFTIFMICGMFYVLPKGLDNTMQHKNYGKIKDFELAGGSLFNPSCTVTTTKGKYSLGTSPACDDLELNKTLYFYKSWDAWMVK